MISGASQKIPITSNPSGAKIIVDGKEMGYAPLNLKLKRKKSHIIRVEKQGYNPLEIRIKRKTSGPSAVVSLLGNLSFGGLVGIIFALGAIRVFAPHVELETEVAIMGVGALFGVGGAFYVDVKSGATFTLSPKELHVTLTKIEGKSQPSLILIDAKKFQNIKWIRIKCTDSGGEEVIINLD